ncbi:MAG: hypothetical protein KY476_07530, partial [Planctomycetes bacterium]|nr:hypothetical protein [Planctomycetota bacterium]
MSRSRKGNKPSGAGDLFARAARELARGDAKAALKDAVVCFRKEASPAHRQLLEQAFVARIEQLHARKQPDDARAVLQRLLEMGPRDSEVVAKLPKLKLMLGSADADAASAIESDPALLVKLVDDAVLDPRTPLPDFANIRDHVARLREALGAVERGEDEAAMLLVGEIPRTSPVSDWKLFVRGLSAFYADDRDRVEQNWRRLEKQRPAARIAATLLLSAGEAPLVDVGADLTAAVQRLEHRLQEDPAAEIIKRLAASWRKAEWVEFFRQFHRLREGFARTHADQIAVLVELAWKRAAREGNRSLLDKLRRAAPAPPLDPHWNRAQALLAEHGSNADANLVEGFWMNYARELAEGPLLREDERALACGLVYRRLGREFELYARDCERESMFFPADVESAAKFREGAAGFYRESIRRWPQLCDSYRELARLHEDLEQPAKAAAVREKLVRQDPDDYNARVWLCNHYLGLDDVEASEPHAETAFRLKPRAAESAKLRWNQQVTTIRVLTCRRKFAEAREAWEAACGQVPDDVEPYTLDTLRCGIDLKAKERAAADEWLQRALSKVETSTPVWMQMSCTAARFKLPREIKRDFDERFKEAIAQPADSATAGRLARFHLMLRRSQVNYTGRATQERLFVKYLQRAKRTSWEARDLRFVLRFLEKFPPYEPLRGDLVEIGLRSFPQDAMIHLAAGELEMGFGPFSCDFARARRHMKRALELAERLPDR